MFLTEAKVYLFTSTAILHDGEADFLADHNLETFTSDASTHAEYVPEVAGRICYMSFLTPRPGGNKAYIDNILARGHGSVLEHAVFGLIFTGISRSCSHELVRHRVGMSYSQLSQRYVNSKDVNFIVPHDLPHNERTRFEDSCNDALEDYRWLSQADLPDVKAKRQMARSVLPNATETKIVVTGNARAWRHFIELRGGGGAEPEIRKLALKVCGVLFEAAPNLFADYTWHTTGDGPATVTTPYRKV